MAIVPSSSHGSTGVGNVAVSGTPNANDIIIASSGTAAAWGPPAASGALTLLSTTTRATDGTIDVSSISQAYNDLILVAILRGTDSGANDNLDVTLNNDGGANYYMERIFASSATAAAVESLGNTKVASGQIPAAAATAGIFAVFTFEICGYTSTTWQKHVSWVAASSLNNSAGNQFNYRGTVRWASTAAVNRVTLVGDSTAALKTGSQLRIYGRL